MKLYLDSADISRVTELLATGIFSGVTTNPAILHKSGFNTSDRARVVRDLHDAGARQIFAQTVSKDVAAIVDEAQSIARVLPGVIAKIPAVKEGLAAANILRHKRIPVLITAVYHPKQALLASTVGAWGIAPYVGRITDSGRDGVGEVRQMRNILQNSDTRVLAASIRDVKTLCELAEQNLHSATISADVAHELLQDEQVSKAVAEFDAVS